MVWLALQQILGGHNQKVFAALMNHCRLKGDSGETPVKIPSTTPCAKSIVVM